MNPHLQNILAIIQQSTNLDADEKNRILQLLQDADKELEITTFKLDRTEKVKKTTAILLEETIQELEQKRKAVEAQNRNLEIESSLERVRTIAMSMKTPDDMGEVCRVISDQLQLLKVKDIRNVQTAIINESKASYLNYQYFTSYDKIEIEKIDYLLHPTVHEFVQVILQSEDAFYTKTFEGVSLQEWREYRQQTNQFPDPKLDETDSVHYYFYSIGQGALGVSAYSPLSADDIGVFQRFRNVFDLAYRRFIDIQTAEAQAKESQIQLALERVRARTMAMQKSNELGEVVLVVFEQLLELGFRSDGCAIVLYNKENLSTEYWMTIPGNTLPQSFTVPYFDHPYYKEELDAWQKGVSYQAFVYEGELKKSFEEFIVNNSPLLNLPDDLLKSLTASEKSVASIAFMDVGSLSVIGPDELSEAHAAILQRFTKTFDQTYTRFLDLQKAEEQAREAQIEAALERIRNRTLLMKGSNELAETTVILFQQFKALDLLPPDARTYFSIIDENNQTAEVWMTQIDGGIRPGSFLMPLSTSEALRNMFNAWKRKDAIHIRDLSGERLKEYIDVLKAIPSLSEDKSYQQLFKSAPERRVISEAIYLQGTIGIISDEPVSTDALDTLVRFGKVFEFTYTRFLDLQKAEAQAREAQIELGLERVRARAMAMQNSEELNALIGTVFTELTRLDLTLTRCVIMIYEPDTNAARWWMANSEVPETPMNFLVKYHTHPPYLAYFKAWQKRKLKWHYVLEGTIKKDWDDFLFSETELSLLPDFVIAGMRAPDRVYLNASFNNFGNLTLASLETLSDEHFDILLRFAKVFDLTYTRFNDLQKAEAQARESQIQLALERVRARTMAMQRSDELANVATTLFQQVKTLGVSQWVCGFGIWEIGDKEFTWYPGSPDGDILTPCKIPLTEHPVFIQFDESRKRGDDLLVYEKEGEIQADHYRYMQSIPGLRELLQNMLDAGLQFPTFQIDHIANFSHGNLVFITYEHFPEMHDIFKRFAKVFEQTYTRFLDLQKAESQAREAQIEVSLERVRSKAMAMQKSEDLADAVAIVFEELDKLNLGMLRCGIGILNKEKRSADVWTTTISDNDTVVQVSGDESMDIHPLLQGAFDAWLNQADHSYVLKGEDLNDYYKALTGVNFKLPDSQSLVTGSEGVQQYYFNAVFSAGGLFAFRETAFPEEAKIILKRFADVFHLTYTRFNDLKQAEAQAREARIEAGLERVRARTMAMHNSEDVSTATATMFHELEKLQIQNFRGGILNIKPDQTMEVWSINPLDDGSLVRAVGLFDMRMHPFWQQLFKGWENKDELLHFNMSGKDKEDYIRILNARRDYLPQGIQQLPDSHVQAYFFGEGAVWTFSLQPHLEEEKQVMKRFASVFSLTFRRYQDLKQAEAQAKEAKIEAALERVRGKAMAMHNSQDLAATIGVFYRELETFSITPRRCGVGLLNRETRMAELSTMNTTVVGDSIEIIGTLKMEGHPVLEGVYNNWLLQKEYHPVLRGNEIKEYYQLLRPQIAFPDYPNDEVQFGYFFFFNEGGVYAWTEKVMNEDELQIYRRFTTVLSLTYKRYIDLKQAEASAKEAVKQSALDHIRADIASMRTTNDLEKITPLIWNELTVLGVPFIRCGVFIMDESQQLIHTFLSTPDGKAFAAFHLPYATPGNISEVLDHWHHKSIYIAHWDESAFTDFAATLVKQGALTSPEQYLKTIPVGGFYLHFFPFLQGMLYVGNTTRLNEDEIKLIQSIADTFSTAYARYEDFKKLESAKEQVEKTLTDLKQAQALLVHSEKMASLGELTAGIAHEIQNPLNFVNNFSEVNQELLQEMEDEIDKGNFKEVKAVAKAIIENEAKINHHGKRAEGIVKSMLQHSRSSSRTKEPTGINALVDEYLRLAYHGLRAKDKSFTATLKHDYDQSIGNINIIPQDMGRVVLNLITNAFHAVTEKRKQSGKGYEPTILVSTKKTNGKIEINIEDNGNGIPAKVLDKIFQPFFTTKPTGSGTGLGLSLAYDIVKAHGGELNVQTREGEGSSFSILLPAI